MTASRRRKVASRANSGSEDNDEVRTGACFGPDDDPHEFGEEIGNGTSGRVFACRRLATNEELAVKVIDLDRLQLLGDVEVHVARLDREVTILRKLQHERIVNLCMLHRTDRYYFIVMERVWGGELFYEIVQRKAFSEPEARHIFLQLLEGISYMHSKCVIHRDLKPENILITRTREAPDGVFHDVKIADFGLSKLICEGASLAKTVVGTPQYWAPEVLNADRSGGCYDQTADFWGLGAVLFVVLCGRYPFDGKKMPMEEQIRTGAFNFKAARWKEISSNAQDIVRGLLQVDPSQRMGLEECLRHPWIASAGVSLTLTSHARLHCKGGYRSASPRNGPLMSPALVTTPEGEPGDEEPSFARWERRSVSGQTRAESSVRSVSPPASSHDVPTSTESERAERPLFWRRVAMVSIIACAFLVQQLATDRAARDASSGTWQYFPRHGAIEDGLHFAASLQHTGMQSVPSVQHSDANSSRDGQHTSSVEDMERTRSTSHSTALWDAARWTSMQVGGGGTDALDKYTDTPHGGLPLAAVWQPIRGPSLGDAADDTPDQGSLALTAPWHWVSNGRPEARVNSSESETADAAQLVTYTEQEVAFRLDELLKLQSSIVGSLQLAFFAMRHTNPELADATRRTFREARDLFQHAADVVSKYSEMAAQVVRMVLPDLELAMEEREPSLAISLLGMVQEWIDTMKVEGQGIQRRYALLQESVAMLEQQARLIDGSVDDRLANLVHAAAFQATSPMAFWESMDATAQKLSHIKEHAERLLSFTSSSERIKERFEQRIDVYATFWKSLGRLCRQYAQDHHTASRRMTRFVQEVNLKADSMDAVDLASHSHGRSVPNADRAVVPAHNQPVL